MPLKDERKERKKEKDAKGETKENDKEASEISFPKAIRSSETLEE